MSKIKICGLKRQEDIKYVNEFKPDFIGFIMASDYPKRYVDDERAAKLKSMLSKDIKTVGVFVNDDLSHIVKVCGEGTIDMVQLHGEEDAEYIMALNKMTDVPVIKAVRVRTTDDIIEAQKYPADYLLLDTYVKGAHGGTGRAFDRTLIPPDMINEHQSCGDIKPYFLAGGLGEDNLADAIKECRPYAVDLSGSVETDGVKDREKIRKVIEIVRSI